MGLGVYITEDVAQEVGVGNFFPRQAVKVEVGIDVGNAVRVVRYMAQGHVAELFFMHDHRIDFLFKIIAG